jgi:hypothetical protein
MFGGCFTVVSEDVVRQAIGGSPRQGFTSNRWRHSTQGKRMLWKCGYVRQLMVLYLSICHSVL